LTHSAAALGFALLAQTFVSAGAQGLPVGATSSGAMGTSAAAAATGVNSPAPIMVPMPMDPTVSTSPIYLPNHAGELLAQSNSSNQSQPTQFDLSPVKLPERGGSAFGQFQNMKMGLLYKLPAKMFLNASVENSLREETNVLQTSSRNHSDMIYRVLPNVTLGYALDKKTRVAANYFFFRDQYMDNSRLLSRNIHSVGFRADRDFQISPRTTITTGIFGRELFITGTDNLTDIIPSVTLVRRVGERGAVYSSVLGQLRWNKMFARWQEGDQFYSFGGVYRLPKWSFLFDTTLIDNFGRPALRGGVASNHVIVMTLEAGRKISNRLPLTAFARVEPIFNIGQEKRTGFAGVNVRIFGGIRAEISKPAIFPVRLRGAG
jgi:hypothetical protein